LRKLNAEVLNFNLHTSIGFTMSPFINTSQNDAFRIVMGYLELRKAKILASNAPSHILAELGSWISVSLGNAKGDVKVEIMKSDGRSQVNLSFSFLKTYLVTILVASIIALFFCGSIWWTASMQTPKMEPSAVQEYISLMSLLTLFSATIVFAILVGIAQYNIHLAKRTFVEEFRKACSINDIVGIKKDYVHS
jgi:hypothetical protein